MRVCGLPGTGTEGGFHWGREGDSATPGRRGKERRGERERERGEGGGGGRMSYSE